MTSQILVVFNLFLPPLANHTPSTLETAKTPSYDANPFLVSFTPFNRLRTPMQRRPMCLTIKNRKEKKNRIALLCLETQARSEGFMAKAFKAWFPKPTGWEPPT